MENTYSPELCRVLGGDHVANNGLSCAAAPGVFGVLSGKFTYCGQPARFLGILNKSNDPFRYAVAWQTKGGDEFVAVVSEFDHDIEAVKP